MSKKKNAACKRPPNAFILFCRDTRPSLVQTFPKMPSSDVSSLLSHLWRSLDVLTKQNYKQQAEKLLIISGNKPPISDPTTFVVNQPLYCLPISSDSSSSNVDKIDVTQKNDPCQHFPMLNPNELFYQIIPEKDHRELQTMFKSIIEEDE